MSDLEHARMMLNLAKQDFLALKGMTDFEIFADGIFGFHAEQAIEKALKAWLSRIHVAYPKTHDLDKLIDLLIEHEQVVPEEFYLLKNYSDFAVRLRYEVVEEDSPAFDRNVVCSKIRAVVEYVEKVLQTSET